VSQIALQAVQIANANRLIGSGNESWGRVVRVSVVKSNPRQADPPYPYVLQFWAGGGHAQAIKTRDANLRMVVKCLSDKMADAMTGAQRLNDLLHNHGRLDNSADCLDGGTYWDILTVTEEDTIYMVETSADTIPIYHVGAYYRYIMQVK